MSCSSSPWYFFLLVLLALLLLDMVVEASHAEEEIIGLWLKLGHSKLLLERRHGIHIWRPKETPQIKIKRYGIFI
jgi:hypothetical protein